MGQGLTLFRVHGVPVRLHPSWLVIFGLLAWSLSVGYFPSVLPDLPAAAYWANGFLAALLLFVSVFLHELSHAVAARRHGIPVGGITLHVFGGVSQLEREPDRPGVEALVAVVGPLTSFGIAAVLAVVLVIVPLSATAAAVLRYLAVVNLVVGLFNLVPGFPLDGGRLLRAALWKLKGNLQWATRVASRAGSVVGFLLIGLGILRGLTGEFLGGLWFVLIGLFLRQAAEGSYQQLVIRRALAPLAVGDVMTRPVIEVPPDLSVARLVDEFFWRHHVSSFPVTEGQRVVGIVSIDRLKELPQERWAGTPVREVMLPASESLTVGPRERLWRAFEKLAQNGVGRLAVVEDGRLVGYLSLKDVFHVLTVSGAGGRPGGAA